MHLHTFTPDQREAIAKVESLRAMREAKHHWRAHYQSMPAAAASTPARDPYTRMQTAAAGPHSFKEISADYEEKSQQARIRARSHRIQGLRYQPYL